MADKKLLRGALKLAEVFRVHPLWGVAENGECLCKKGGACRTPGKHPIKGGWQRSATQNPEEIKRIWRLHPFANPGAAVTEKHIIVDVDKKNGGFESLEKYEKKFGCLPITLEIITGGGGRHLVFLRPKEFQKIKIKNKVGVLPGIDIRAEGGNLVGLGSRHRSGNYYEEGPFGFSDNLVVELKHGPFLDLLRQDTAKIKPQKKIRSGNFPQVIDSKVSEGTRNDFLFRAGCSLKSRGFAEGITFKLLKIINKEVCSPPVSDDEVSQIWGSTTRYLYLPNQDSPKSNLTAEYFYGALGDLSKSFAKESEASPEAILGQLIVVIGNVVGRSTLVNLGNIRLFLNIMLMIVGDSAVGRKGTGFKVAKDIVVNHLDFKSLNFASGLSTGEGLIYAIRDPGMRRVSKGKFEKDPGVLDKRLMVFEPEAVRIFRNTKRDSNILSPILRDAADGGDLQTLTRTEPIKATGPHISVIAHITKFELQRELDDNSIFNGFANRCLWIYSERSKLLPFGGREVLEHPKAKILRDRFSDFIDSRALILSESAKPLWESIYHDINHALQFDNEKLKALKARATDHILRVAGIFCLTEGATEIQNEHLKASFAFWNYSSLTVDYCFSRKERDQLSKVLTAMKKNGGQITRNQIKELFSNNNSREQNEELKGVLLDKGLIFVTEENGVEIWKLSQRSDDLRPFNS